MQQCGFESDRWARRTRDRSHSYFPAGIQGTYHSPARAMPGGTQRPLATRPYRPRPRALGSTHQRAITRARRTRRSGVHLTARSATPQKQLLSSGLVRRSRASRPPTRAQDSRPAPHLRQPAHRPAPTQGRPGPPRALVHLGNDRPLHPPFLLRRRGTRQTAGGHPGSKSRGPAAAQKPVPRHRTRREIDETPAMTGVSVARPEGLEPPTF